MKPTNTSLSNLAARNQPNVSLASAGAPTAIASSPAAQVGGRFYQYRGFILLAFLILNIWLNFSYIKPLVMGAIIAIVLFPFMGKFDRWKHTKRLSATMRASIITIAFTLLILIPIGFLLFAGIQAAVTKIGDINITSLTAGRMSFKSFANEFGLGSISHRLEEMLPISEQQFQSYATKGLAAAAAFGANVVQNLVTSIPGMLFSNIVLLFTMFFLLIDGPRAVRFVQQNSIFNRIQTDRIITQAGLLCNSVIVATLVSGAVQAGIVGLIGIFTGTGNLILIMFVTFISSFFPLVGTAPVILFLSGQAFAAGDTTVGIVWLVSMGIVGMSDNVVRPYVLKGGAELHPLIGFVAAFGALEMIGFYGLFIGPIVAGLFFTLLPMVTRTYPRAPRATH